MCQQLGKIPESTQRQRRNTAGFIRILLLKMLAHWRVRKCPTIPTPEAIKQLHCRKKSGKHPTTTGAQPKCIHKQILSCNWETVTNGTTTSVNDKKTTFPFKSFTFLLFFFWDVNYFYLLTYKVSFRTRKKREKLVESFKLNGSRVLTLWCVWSEATKSSPIVSNCPQFWCKPTKNLSKIRKNTETHCHHRKIYILLQTLDI